MNPAQPKGLRSARTVRGDWTSPGAADRYDARRWSNARRAARDPALVDRLLERAGVREAVILDAPCGTGRLTATLAERACSLVGLDASPRMLSAAPADRVRLAQGDVFALPFADDSFDAVVSCRLLHHLADPADLRAAVAELVRVSRGVVVASFWDRASLADVRRRLRPRRRGRRVAHSKATLAAAFDAAGARVVDHAHSMRLLSAQTFCLARTSR